MVLVSLAIAAGTAQANKSVFIISKHVSPSAAQAYKIEGAKVVYHADVDISC